MFIRLESSSGVPIIRQIADQVRMYCVNGTLAAGDRLPSVRELARQLAVNQNTILHVYQRLTDEGLLERRQGDGTYVADKLPAGRGKAQRDALARAFDRIAHQAIGLGLQRELAHQLLDESIDRLQRDHNRKGQSS